MDNDISYRMPLHRCFILALILTFLAVLYYGYYSYSIGDYMLYSLSAVNKLYPENFLRDAYVQTYNDFHPTFTWILYRLMAITSELVGPFIIFIISKFLIFFGIILLAQRFIKKNILYIFFIIFLFPFIYFGLAHSYFGSSFPFPVPRAMSWGLYFMGFHFFLSKKYTQASIWWGLSSLFHAQFIFFTFPLLVLGTIFFNPYKKFCKKNIYPFIVFSIIPLPEVISILRNIPFQIDMANKDYYFYFVEKLFSPNFNPKYYLLQRGDLFMLLNLPLLVYWQRVMAIGESARMVIMAIALIFVGTIICIFFTSIVFVKSIMWLWYPGFTPFVTLLSVIFLIAATSEGWKIEKKNYFFIGVDILFIYAFVFSPYAGAILFITKNLFQNITTLRVKNILRNAIAMILLFAAAPWGMGYQHYLYVKPWSGLNFSMPEVVYYIRNYTKPDSLFLVPPIVWFMQPYAYRSTVVDYSHPGLNGYALEWKKRMDEITGIDIFGKDYKNSNNFYAEMPTERIKNIIKKYEADYYMTFNSGNLKDKFEKDKSFQLVYWDSEYLIYKIINSSF